MGSSKDFNGPFLYQKKGVINLKKIIIYDFDGTLTPYSLSIFVYTDTTRKEITRMKEKEIVDVYLEADFSVNSE